MWLEQQTCEPQLCHWCEAQLFCQGRIAIQIDAWLCVILKKEGVPSGTFIHNVRRKTQRVNLVLRAALPSASANATNLIKSVVEIQSQE